MTMPPATRKNPDEATLTIFEDGAALRLQPAGAWTVRSIASADHSLRALKPGRRSLEWDLGALSHLDTAGAWLIVRTAGLFEAAGGTVAIRNAGQSASALIAAVRAIKVGGPETAVEEGSFVMRVFARTGAGMETQWHNLLEMLAFGGLVIEGIGRAIVSPRRLRVTSIVHHMEETGLKAVPIVCLMSFLIGAVLAFQGAGQLERFGAEPFTVNLVGISILREIGILLTAIMVAGRSGSAFTAQLGSMKMREEIDAIRTLGLDPLDLLVLPRVIALVLTLPLLGFVADIMGLIGGAMVAWSDLGLSPATYISLLREAVTPAAFWVGIAKAPVFAFLIGIIGCLEGMRVTGTAESVGRRTTQSVVEGIFVVIIADAIFSIVFLQLGI